MTTEPSPIEAHSQEPARTWATTWTRRAAGVGAGGVVLGCAAVAIVLSTGEPRSHAGSERGCKPCEAKKASLLSDPLFSERLNATRRWLSEDLRNAPEWREQDVFRLVALARSGIAEADVVAEEQALIRCWAVQTIGAGLKRGAVVPGPQGDALVTVLAALTEDPVAGVRYHSAAALLDLGKGLPREAASSAERVFDDADPRVAQQLRHRFGRMDTGG